MNYEFSIERDYETKPYNWNYWDNYRIVKSVPANILAFYKVYLNGDKQKWYSFEIRKEDNGEIAFDHDDTLTEYLFRQKVGLKEVNAIVQRIFHAMDKDYFGQDETD